MAVRATYGCSVNYYYNVYIASLLHILLPLKKGVVCIGLQRSCMATEFAIVCK